MDDRIHSMTSDRLPASQGSAAVSHEAAKLRDRLAETELELLTLEGELAAFYPDYMREVGTVMARVEEIEARILRAAAERSGSDADRHAAQEAEERVRRTTASIEAVPEPPGPAPPEDIKRLFREAAKRIHPDLADDEEGRAHAEAFMKRLNVAYHEGDAAAITDLLRQWQSSPYAGPEGEASAERARRELEGLRAAVQRAERRLAEARAVPLADTMEKVLAAAIAGEDLLPRMRADARAALAAAQARLAELDP